MNYNCNIWPRWSHTLTPLTRLTPIKNEFKWTQVEQYDFDRINRIVAHDTLLTYTDFNETFKIHIDDSVLQLGAVTSDTARSEERRVSLV